MNLNLRNDYTIIANRQLTYKTWVMTLRGDTGAITSPDSLSTSPFPESICAVLSRFATIHMRGAKSLCSTTP